MNEEIGNAAGTVWSALHAQGEMSLKQLKDKQQEQQEDPNVQNSP